MNICDNGLLLYTRNIVTGAITKNNKYEPYPEAYISRPVNPRAGIKTIKETNIFQPENIIRS